MRMLTLVLAVLALSAFIGCQSKPMVGSDVQSDREGITVHGNWTVEVRNPDGSLATRKQFTNTFYGQEEVAAFLSFDIENVIRNIYFNVSDAALSPVNWNLYSSDEAKCEEATTANPVSTLDWKKAKIVPANTTHAPNADGEMFNSIWNATCTLEITGDEPKFLYGVTTKMERSTSIPRFQGDINAYAAISSKMFDESIEVWDGQGISATVIMSVE